MNIGMLWYDDDKKRSLEDKIAKAVDFYLAKYAAQPTDCYINPKTMGEVALTTKEGLRLHPSKTVIKDHFWLGVTTPSKA